VHTVASAWVGQETHPSVGRACARAEHRRCSHGGTETTARQKHGKRNGTAEVTNASEVSRVQARTCACTHRFGQEELGFGSAGARSLLDLAVSYFRFFLYLIYTQFRFEFRIQI
jgi:hypothetical protein